MSDRFIPYGRQSIDEADIEAVASVLRSDFLTQGPVIERFEELVKIRVRAKHAIAVNSATSALHIACAALGVGPGSRLWTVPNTFVATANCARYCGAEVDFVDIDPRTYNLDPVALENKLQAAAAESTLPVVVAAVDFSGQPCDWNRLRELKARYGFRLIEDASHALGASYRGRPVGSITGADVTIFSFHPVKIVATGEGGVAVTDDPEVADRIAALRSHGIVRNPERFELSSEGPWYYEQQLLGFNYRMTELQAALGCSQMAKLDSFLSRRREIAGRYDELLSGMPVTRPHQLEGTQSAWHLYVILVEAGRRREVFERLRAANIGVQVHYIPVHLQPYYRKFGFKPGDFPVAETYYQRTISLPMFPALTDSQQDRVVYSLRAALGD